MEEMASEMALDRMLGGFGRKGPPEEGNCIGKNPAQRSAGLGRVSLWLGSCVGLVAGSVHRALW